MRNIIVSLAVAATSVWSPSLAQTPEQMLAMMVAEKRGAELYRHDRAAWLATDELFKAFPDPVAAGLAGWITEQSGDDIVVTFFRSAGEKISAAYRVTYANGKITSASLVDKEFTPSQMRLYQARVAAMKSDFQRCTEAINTVVLPDGDDTLVYMMPGMSEAEKVPFGGFTRVRVDGQNNLKEIYKFTNSCLILPLPKEAAGLMVTQVIGDTPTEVHVFTSLSFGAFVAVGSKSGNWKVEGGRISPLANTRQP